MADDIFLQILEDAKFMPRKLYWLAVRIFGGLFMNMRKYITRKTEGSMNVAARTKTTKKKKARSKSASRKSAST
jgi:hypothetical protein